MTQPASENSLRHLHERGATLAPQPGQRVVATRIDPPHHVQRAAAAESSPAIELAVPDVEPGTAAPPRDRLVRQARQLASLLRGQSRDLDRRESHVHASIAEVERRQRELELWLSERQAEFDDRERRLSEREQLAWNKLIEQELSAAELTRREKALERGTRRVGRRMAWIEQKSVELSRKRQQTLEMRIATEALWAELVGEIDPVLLEQSLAELRQQLSDEFRQSRMALKREQAHLARARHELAQTLAQQAPVQQPE